MLVRRLAGGFLPAPSFAEDRLTVVRTSKTDFPRSLRDVKGLPKKVERWCVYSTKEAVMADITYSEIERRVDALDLKTFSPGGKNHFTPADIASSPGRSFRRSVRSIARSDPSCSCSRAFPWSHRSSAMR